MALYFIPGNYYYKNVGYNNIVYKNFLLKLNNWFATNNNHIYIKFIKSGIRSHSLSLFYIKKIKVLNNYKLNNFYSLRRNIVF